MIQPIRACIDASAKHFGVPAEEICGARRTEIISRARHAAIYVARKQYNCSLAEIGRRMNKSRAAICLAVKRAPDRLRHDPSFARGVRMMIQS